MASLRLILITGRSAKQGIGISAGKEGFEYRQATGVIELSRSDMLRSGLKEGERVRLTSRFGSADATCRGTELPEGLAFMAFGPPCNRLIGDETSASGMPDSKHVEVAIDRIGAGGLE
jgi:formylmethanofuran dehydrogenase subunit D